MRPEQYDPEALASLLRQREIATMEDLKQALGTAADATVFRKPAGLDYKASYLHRGRYYTLYEVARFDALGLWSFCQVFFSSFGTLVANVEALVLSAEAGYDAAEFEIVLNVEAKAALLKLVRSGRLSREQVSGRYVDLSPEPSVRRAELRAGSAHDAGGQPSFPRPGLGGPPRRAEGGDRVVLHQ